MIHIPVFTAWVGACSVSDPLDSSGRAGLGAGARISREFGPGGQAPSASHTCCPSHPLCQVTEGPVRGKPVTLSWLDAGTQKTA